MTPGAGDEIGDATDALRRAGWSVGDAAFTGPGGLVWLVSGHNGENLIRAEEPTRADAWRAAVEQARSPGMLGGWRGRHPGEGRLGAVRGRGR
jgi:hypothetical protein